MTENNNTEYPILSFHNTGKNITILRRYNIPFVFLSLCSLSLSIDGIRSSFLMAALIKCCRHFITSLQFAFCLIRAGKKFFSFMHDILINISLRWLRCIMLYSGQLQRLLLLFAIKTTQKFKHNIKVL